MLEINSATFRIFAPGAPFGDPFEFAIFIGGKTLDTEAAGAPPVSGSDVLGMAEARAA